MRLRGVFVPGSSGPVDVDIPGAPDGVLDAPGCWWVPSFVDPRTHGVSVSEARASGFSAWFGRPGVATPSPGLTLGSLVNSDGKIADVGTSLRQGAVGLGLDGWPDAAALRVAFEAAAAWDVPVFVGSVDLSLGASAVVAEGRASQALGLPGLPSEAEAVAISSACWLARRAGVRRLVVGPVSTADALAALAPWPNVAAFTTVHHLVLDETFSIRQGLAGGSRLWPPPQRVSDLNALGSAVVEGRLWLGTDHCRHPDSNVNSPPEGVVPGVPGLRRAASLALQATGPAAGLAALAAARQWFDVPEGHVLLDPLAVVSGDGLSDPHGDRLGSGAVIGTWWGGTWTGPSQ